LKGDEIIDATREKLKKEEIQISNHEDITSLANDFGRIRGG